MHKIGILSLFLSLSLTSCLNRQVVIGLDACVIQTTDLSAEVKAIISIKNQQAIVENNRLYFCFCPIARNNPRYKDFKSVCKIGH